MKKLSPLLFLVFIILSFQNVAVAQYTISGKISIIYDFKSKFKLMYNGADKTHFVNAQNEFEFTVPTNNPYKLEVKGGTDALNGVNVGDVIAIQNHIINKARFTLPTQFLKADIVRDGNIDLRDLIEIKKLLLGRIDEFKSGSSWYFIDANYNITLQNWAQTSDYILPSFDQNGKAYVEFVSYKIGDVQ